MRALVLNSRELRSGLLKAYRCRSSLLTEDEWRAIKGLYRQLETAAARQGEEPEVEIKTARESGSELSR
jgi:hypothetical protein